MANARRVTEAEALGEVEQTPIGSTQKRYAPIYVDQRIPGDTYDRIRLEAREATYRNSQDEAATIAAVDQAIFARIREDEQGKLDEATRLLLREDANATRPDGQPVGNALRRAEAHLAELRLIREELAAGRDTASLVARYKKVERAMQAGDGRRLLALADKTDSRRRNVADPVAAAQKSLTFSPLSTWRPLGIRNW